MGQSHHREQPTLEIEFIPSARFDRRGSPRRWWLRSERRKQRKRKRIKLRRLLRSRRLEELRQERLQRRGEVAHS